MKTRRSRQKRKIAQEPACPQIEMENGLRILARIIARRLSKRSDAGDSNTETKPENLSTAL
jgi:hypothetical protein